MGLFANLSLNSSSVMLSNGRRSRAVKPCSPVWNAGSRVG